MNTELPTPSLKRWQPLRCGVLNLYKYDDQVFVFEGGRLLLRGNNGTGKSRVLALTLPFLFDARIESHRVEPDADSAKKMEWNLLMGRIDDRTGYSWIEFGRLCEDGAHEYLTLGCGLRASQGRQLQRWFFITPRRIGPELQLTKNKTPHTEATLTQILEGNGRVFRDATIYRTAVDQQLFGLGPRYEALLNLLIQLRKPQLTRKLDEEQLSRALSEALPPLDPKVLEDVAEAFRELDEQRGQLHTYRDAHDAVQEFLEKYRHYVQVAVRIRAKAAMKAHREWHDKGRAVRHHEAEWKQAEGAYHARKAEKEGREIEASGLTSKVQTLKQNQALQDMDSARQAAEQTAKYEKDMRGELDGAKSRLDASNHEVDEAVSAEDVSLADAEKTTAYAATWAAQAALDDIHRDAVAAIDLLTLNSESDAESARTLLDEPIRRRSAAIKALQARVNEVEVADRDVTTALTKVEEMTSAVSAAEENERTKHRAMQAAGEALAQSYRVWSAQSHELQPLGADQMDELLDAWMEHQDGAIPVAAVIAEAHRGAEQRLAGAEATTRRELEDVKARSEEVDAVLDFLKKGRHEPPKSPPTRDPRVREITVGAPLWRLCEFQDSFPAEHRGCLEAALEASGLLDSWVLPDGGWLSPDHLDVAISHRSTVLPNNAPTLLAALKPDVANFPHGFLPETVEAVLARVGLGESDGGAWVAPSGEWRLGPMRGAWRKEAAQHLGASAREAERQRRILELSDQAASHRAEIERLNAGLAEIGAKRERAKTEANTAPGDDTLRTAMANVAVAKEQLTQSRQRLIAAEAERKGRERVRDECTALRDKDARDFGLLNHVARLDALGAALGEYVKALLVLWPGLQILARARVHTSKARLRAEADQAQVARRSEALQDAQTKAASASSHYKTLRENVGANVDELLAELAETEETLTGLNALIKADGAMLETYSRASAAALSSKDLCETELPQLEQNRRREALHLMELARQRLLTVAADEFKPFEAADRTVDETVQLAREVDRALQNVPSEPGHWQDQQTSIHSHVNVLGAALLPHNFPPTTSLTPDGVLVVTVSYQGAMQSMTEIRMALATEMTTRETQLTLDEQKVIEKYLLNEAAQELHERLRDAEKWKNDASEELQARPMGSGMRLRFAWQPRSEGFPGLPEAIKLLHQHSAMWSEQERKDLGAFLGDRIRDAHRNSEKGEWKDHLAQALDYREWHIFTVERWQDGRWERLTKKKHGTGSGGEKAVALTLPQFTAAAAFYKSAPNAPRLIMLDEAFVGVDRDMRRKCMDLLTIFDLDLVMTSESEWGCYPTVPALAIYQLASSPDAVAATRWVWNGREQRLDDKSHGGACDTAV